MNSLRCGTPARLHESTTRSTHAFQFLAQGQQSHTPHVQIELTGEAYSTGELVCFGEYLVGRVQRKGSCSGDGLGLRTVESRFPGQPATRLEVNGAL